MIESNSIRVECIGGWHDGTSPRVSTGLVYTGNRIVLHRPLSDYADLYVVGMNSGRPCLYFDCEVADTVPSL